MTTAFAPPPTVYLDNSALGCLSDQAPNVPISAAALRRIISGAAEVECLIDAVRSGHLAHLSSDALAAEERQQVITTIYQAVGPDDAARVLAALAGTLQEVWALPDPLQDRVQEAILEAFPPGQDAVVVSQLSIASVGTDTWLPALRGRYAGRGVDAVADAIERGRGQPLAEEREPPAV